MNINMLMQKAQEEVGKMIFTSEQPLVKVEVNGKKEIVSIKIKEDIELDDLEMLEDMIMIAINDALVKASNEMEQRLSKYGQGLPGLF